MKAIKINKIEWNLSGLTEQERQKAINTLPVVKAFITKDDNFNVCERVPKMLEKKYGYGIISFSHTVCRVVDDIEDLLALCAPVEKKATNIFTITGNLSAYGKKCLNNLEANIKWRQQLEHNGTSDFDMPQILDEVMLGLENVCGTKWSNDILVLEWRAKLNKVIYKTKQMIKQMKEEIEYECED